MTDSALSLLREFWLRDYEADVAQLNADLRKGKSDDAGLVAVPPSVLTGDLTSKRRGDCILVLGINPAWQGDLNCRFQREDIQPSLRAYAKGDFEEYAAIRATFFRGSKAHYGRHFTRLGNAMRGPFGTADAHSDAQGFLDDQAIILDCLPWWSKDTRKLDLREAINTQPVRAWQTVVKAIIETWQPKAIVVNTSGNRSLVEHFLDVRLQKVDGVKPSFGGVTSSNSRVFVHRQLGSPGGASHSQYADMVRSWKTLLAAVDMSTMSERHCNGVNGL